MNFIFDIIINRSDINKLNIVEEMIEWDEEKFSQEPPKYTYKSMITLYENSDSYYQNIIEGFNNQKNIILTLEEEQLSELEFLVNNKQEKICNNGLIGFLREIYDILDWFYIFMYRDEECIDDKYVATDADEFIKTFCNALKKYSPKGIAITKWNSVV